MKQHQEQQSGSEESKDSYSDDDDKSDNPDELDIDMECMMQVEEESDNMQKKTQDGQSNKEDVNVRKNEEKQSSNQMDSLQEAKQDVNVQKKSSPPTASKHDSDETQTADISKEKVIKNEGNTCTSASITAGKLVNKAKARIKGTWHFAKKHKKIDIKARMCKLCGLVKETLEKLEKHMHKKHKKFKYKCQFCSKLYKSKNGIYKHKLYHTIGLRYICKKCDKGFMFFSQYREHSNVHTDSVKHKFPCRKTGCNKYYGSTHACNYHEQHHKGQVLKCTFQEKKGGPKCGVMCNSKQSMDIHVRGTHGEGWNALCRKHYYWPAGKTKHEKKCTQCKAIKKKNAKK